MSTADPFLSVPQTRAALEAFIEAAIALLDAMDGDVDREDDELHDGHDDAELEEGQ